jgi:Co/Zn/Cd efflux system component
LLFAFVAGSEAMMGDSAAMIVDSITYCFNWIAERRKRQFDVEPSASFQYSSSNSLSPAEQDRIHQRAKRKMVLQLEVVPPIISVTTLVAVTVLVTKRAVHVLSLDMHRSRDQQSNPNVGLMLIFSVFNLGLDGLNVFCFARAKHLLGYSTEIEPDADILQGTKVKRATGSERKPKPSLRKPPGGYSQVEDDSTNDTYDDPEGVREASGADVDENDDNNSAHREASATPSPASTSHDPEATKHNHHDSHDHHHDHHEHANLNMCSAYTHVVADTLRSIAVIIASALAEFVPDVTPEEADATAAVVVSFLILLSLLPLLHGLARSVTELRMILAEEETERVLLLRQARRGSFELI